MNYDDKYIIRLAEMADVDGIMCFIDEYWKKGHILGNNKEFFLYEHADQDRINFLLAIDRKSKEIEGILGFLPASHDASTFDIWTGIWKVRDGVLPLLGMELYKRLPQMVGARTILGVGDSQTTTGPLLRKLTKTFNTWRMRHFYYLADRNDFFIADVKDKYIQEPKYISRVAKVKKIDDISETQEYVNFYDHGVVPYKDLSYINHRYFKHPIYNYDVYGIQLDDSKALIVIRKQEYEQRSVVRIVDYIGEQICFSGINSFIRELLSENDCEYVDFYTYGFQYEYIFEAGFTERMENDSIVIPDYFNPFERRNVEIWVSGNVETGLFTKADGDQDRPN